MTKADIIERVATAVGCPKSEAFQHVECLFGLMKDTLEDGDSLKIARFGVFEVKRKNDRRGRNPMTGEEIRIEARRVLTFKASGLLKQTINMQS